MPPRPGSLGRENEAIVKDVVQKIEEDQHRTYTLNRQVEENDRMYRADPDEKLEDEPGKPKANVASLEYHRCVESVVSAVDAIIFSDDPFFLPWSDETRDDAVDATRNTLRVMRHQHDEMGLRNKVGTALRSFVNHGTSVVFTPWIERKRWMDLGKEYEPVTYYDGPDFVPVPYWRWHHDDVSDPNDLTWGSMEYMVSKTRLQGLITAIKEENGPGTETRDLDGLELGAPITSEGSQIAENLAMVRGYNLSEGDGDKVHLDHYFGLHPRKKHPNDPKGKMADPLFWEILLVNRRYAVAQRVNPYRNGHLPWLIAGLLQNDEKLEGMGLADIVGRQYIAINERKCLMSDIVTMSLYGMWQRTSPAGGRTASRVRLFPGKIFDQVIDGVLNPLKVDTSVLRPAMALDGIDIEEMRAASAATANVQGIKQGGTATEIRNIAQESARRVASTAIAFGEKIMRPFLQRQAEHTEQFGPEYLSVAEAEPDGTLVGRRIPKIGMLRKPKMRMNMALDLENRPRLRRDLSQAISQQANLLTALPPQIGQVFLPNLLQMVKKNALLYNLNPSDVVPPEAVQAALNLLKSPPPPPAPPPGAAGPKPPPTGIPQMPPAVAAR